jgi:uridine kinase
MDCAGKSTMASQLQDLLRQDGYQVALVSIDSFLVPAKVKARREPEWLGYFEDAFDYDAFRRAISGTSTELANGPQAVILAEGVFLLREELRELWDFAVFLAVDDSLVTDRALVRDLFYFGDEQNVRRVYEGRCTPAQRHHECRDNPRAHTDVVAKFNGVDWVLDALLPMA